MVYIGMKPAESALEELQRELDIAYQKRKQEQASVLRTSRPTKFSTKLLLSLLRRGTSVCRWKKVGYSKTARSLGRGVARVFYKEDAHEQKPSTLRPTAHARSARRNLSALAPTWCARVFPRQTLPVENVDLKSLHPIYFDFISFSCARQGGRFVFARRARGVRKNGNTRGGVGQSRG